MPLTRTEATAASVAVLPAVAITWSWLLDLAGLAFLPGRVLVLSAATTAAAGWCLTRAARSRGAGGASWKDSVGWLAVCVAALTWLLRLAWPSLLPIGGGDLTHHLQLIDYLERHWRLVHDPAVEAYLGEMVHYTPGVHLLAALGGRWFGLDGLHMTHPVVAFTLALKAGFVYLVALRLLAPQAQRHWLALAAPLLLLAPHAFTLDGFLRDSFLAQVASEMFAVAMWWSLVVWNDEESAIPMALFATFGIATFLTWPIWIGPPVVALGLLLLLRRRPALRQRAQHGMLALAPVAVVVLCYLAGRASMLGMSGAAGAVLRPTLGNSAPELLALAVTGILVATRGAVFGRLRPTLYLSAGIGLQAAALYLQARLQHNPTAYMAFKTLYLAPYPLAILALVPLAAVVRHREPRESATSTWPWLPVATTLVVVMLVSAGGVARVASVRRDPPALTEPVWQAGAWARDHLPRGCIAYLVADDDTAYWLHLAVLRNPRVSPRSADLETYLLGPTVMRWYDPAPGLPYAIADLPRLARGIREDLDIVAPFGPAAVVKRRGATVCPDQHLPPAP